MWIWMRARITDFEWPVHGNWMRGGSRIAGSSAGPTETLSVRRIFCTAHLRLIVGDELGICLRLLVRPIRRAQGPTFALAKHRLSRDCQTGTPPYQEVDGRLDALALL